MVLKGKLCFLLVKSGLTQTDLELRYLHFKSVEVTLDLATKIHGFEKKVCFLRVKLELTPTDLEFRYLNSKSVGVKPDLATKTHGFERKLCFLLVKSGLTPTDLGFRYLNSKSFGVKPDWQLNNMVLRRSYASSLTNQDETNRFGVQVLEPQIRWN